MKNTLVLAILLATFSIQPQLHNYEFANFLVLTANPLTDFANVKTIELRIKRGEPLQP